MFMRLRKRHGFTLIELLVVISIILILITFIMPQIGNARAKARSVKSLNNLRVLGSALLQYADDNDGAFPADLADLYSGYVGDYKVFDSPSGGMVVSAPGAGKVSSTDYVYCPGLTDQSGGGTVIAAEVSGLNSNGDRGVLFVSGSVRMVPSSEIGTGAGKVDLTNVVKTVGG